MRREADLPVHLSEHDVRRYREGDLSGTELVDVLDHIAACSFCCGLAGSGEEQRASALKFVAAVTKLAPELNHLTYDQKAGFVDQTLSADQRRIAASHLRYCTDCALEVKRLHELKSELGASTRGGLWGRLGQRWNGLFGMKAVLALAGVVACAVLLVRQEPKGHEIALPAPAASATMAERKTANPSPPGSAIVR